MFKKISVVTALSTALLFGGSLSNVNAAEKADQSQVQLYKVLYSVNGGNFQNLSEEKINNLLNKYLKDYQINWNWNKADQKQDNQKKQKEVKKPEQNKEQEQPKQEPKKEQPKQEQPKQEQPKQEQQAQPEKSQASTQQPAEQQEQQSQAQEQSQQLSQFEQQVVELTNNEREKQGLEPLQIDVELSKVAREKSRDMQAKGYFAHNSPTYGSPFDMMKQFGIDYRTAGENIAKGQRTPEEVVNAWMNSEGHRANILNPEFTHIGVGYVAEGNHWTQQFIGK
ncbi:CAP domain-containing protein [Virgibacillus ndiopensis]|uniref:CAP domain-containing protein n=1 Tax=Virgibacillus ndiopensis TaxID=2004408 RepID=UPI000C07E5F5|nr:CAP domain-containing protein [Virgibacillus ndiopensis]